MKKSRIIVLFLALAAAAGAFMMAGGSSPPPPAPVAALPPPPPPPPTTDDVLVAAKDLPLGTRIGDGDMDWRSWPKDAIPAGMLRKTQDPKALDEFRGATVRSAMVAGEPVLTGKLIKGDGGLMAVILPSGKRAVAINIDSQGATTAGGFILPNDRVDVVRTYRQDAKPGLPTTGGDNFTTDTLLTNVKVLAIGQNVQEKNGQPVVVGSNATLELDPAQAETVILAQRTGQLSLVLRSVLDAHQAEAPSVVHEAAHGLSVVRYGTVSEDTGR
ncbi:Flp pilus assembly protein CpaB [Lichenibacterium dinghuense]|uniref:Flp pilus assembly protein CpaB n=1 Tax=Lichenibacterium dinghuense TaxID=2895977 RepID=UPI001F443F6C|nr:Flp pilus assembly protein CpaB [Lichenibacterium sp. 6Y81]